MSPEGWRLLLLFALLSIAAIVVLLGLAGAVH